MLPTKRRIQEFWHSLGILLKWGLANSILFTVVPGMLLGPGLPSPSLIIFTLTGTWLVACASFVYNQIIEVERDALMERTKARPLVTRKFSHNIAHVVGSGLLVLGMYIIDLGANSLAAIFALLSFFHYIFVYTIYLKPRTSWNTLIGGFSGSVGPLIGEAAVSGKVSEYGIAMFLLLFLWQPPHFWGLALRYKQDYERAKIPMLPVVRGELVTCYQMIFYQVLLCICMVAISLPPFQLSGPIFLYPSLAWGLLVLYFMFRLLRQNKKGGDTKIRPMLVFFLTIAHMLLWHITITLDIYLRFWF